MSRVSGMCAPMFLTQVAILFKSDFLGNAGCRISTWPFFPFLSVEGRLLRFLIRLALLMGTYAFNSFQQSEKRAHVQRHHAFLIEIVLVLPCKWTHTQHMSPELSLREWIVLRFGAGICVGVVVEAWHLSDVGIELLYSTYKLTYVVALWLLKFICDVVLFLLSRVDWKRGEKVKHHTIVKQLM